MKKHAVIFAALLFSFNLLAGTSAAGQSDCVSKCLPQPAKSKHEHASGAAVRLMHLNCCSGKTALPCELASHRTPQRPDCSFSTCRSKVPHSNHTALTARPMVPDGFTASGMGLKSGTNIAGKAPPIYLQNLSILC